VDNVLLEWNLALSLTELGVVKSILPVLLGKEAADGTRPNSFFSDGSDGGGQGGYATLAHPPTAAKEKVHLASWEEQTVQAAAVGNGGALGPAQVEALGVQLCGSPLSAESVLRGAPAVDVQSFLGWWRSDANPNGSCVTAPSRTVAQTMDSIKKFQGLGCHSIRRSGEDEKLGGEALAQEVANRIAKVASEHFLSVSRSEKVRTEAAAVQSAGAELGSLSTDALREELERRATSL